MDDGRFPQLVAFDLDYTLWDFWIDTHIDPPLALDAVTGTVYDSALCPTKVAFYRDVPETLRGLKHKPDVTVVAASRTSATKLAREALRLVTIPVPDAGRVDSIPAIRFFDQLEIYPGSKIAHFKQFHKVTGIPYSEMLFFDDELRNKEVERQLGVTFILVRKGVNWDCFRKGLQEWRKRRAADDVASN